MSDSWQPHELQHARPPCPTTIPWVYPNPCPLSRWYHPTISSSVIPFSSCPQTFPASGSFQISQQIHVNVWQKPLQYCKVISLQLIKKKKKAWIKKKKKSALHIRWLKYCSFSFNISPSSEYPGPISCRMNSLDLLAVQGTLKSLVQHYTSKASILWHSAFFIVQLLYPYMTTGKTITLTRWTFGDKVMSLLFNMLSWS